MIEIKAGNELDRAVAVAIGFRRVIQIGPKPDFSRIGLFEDFGPAEFVEVGADDQRMPAEIILKYSTDLNAAFAAAEKTWKRFWVKKLGPDKYEAIVFCDGDDGWSRFDEQSTPALAICAAILKAKA